MISDNLAVVLYTSTKGHFGYKNAYKFTVKRLEKEIPLFDNFYKVAHIKWSPEDSIEILEEMEGWLQQRGFDVLVSKGEWSHNKSSHAVEYYKDKLKAFSNNKLHRFPYTLFIEDDYLFEFNDLFSAAVTESLLFLNKDLNALCVRINKKEEEDLSNAQKHSELIYKQGLEYTIYGPTLTFQPTIIRTKEWYHSLRIINNNREILDTVHCELISGKVISQFSDSPLPFYFFNPKKIWCEHIGEEEKLKRLNNE